MKSMALMSKFRSIETSIVLLGVVISLFIVSSLAVSSADELVDYTGPNIYVPFGDLPQLIDVSGGAIIPHQ